MALFFFSLGTVPLMFTAGIAGNLLSARHARVVTKISAILVIVLGLMMACRGLSLAGVSFAAPLGNQLPQNAAIAQVKNGVQTITTELEENRYPALVVKTGIPVRWTMHASSSKINDCNHELVISSFGIQQTLRPGDNVIQFTPKAQGELPYTCWMGMITGRIIIRDTLPVDKP